MAGREERVLLVFPDPYDALLRAGGTIARLAEDGAGTLVLTSVPEVAGVDEALYLMGARECRVVTMDAHAAIASAIDEQDSTAIIVPHQDTSAFERDELGLVRLAVAEASARRLPLYLAVNDILPVGRRLKAIDVSDQLDAKLDAISSCTGISVDGRIVRRDGAEARSLGETEAFVRLSAPGALEDSPPSVGSRIVTGVLAFFVGAVFGAIGTIAHQSTVEVAGVDVPWGLILSLSGITALLVGLRLVLNDRLIVLATAIGLLGTIFLLSLRSTGGSVLIPQSALGLVWTVAPTLISTIVLAWPRLPARLSRRA
ncbi:hypothetical protein [Luethyella okanaganae]|uniref:Uncharacterized protein n=1 Tax=Luethyella okanaganae TaxID=69372 RepID=A0ABW1VEC7_9MICO